MWSAGQSCLDGFPSVTDNTCTSSSCPFQGISSSQQLRLFPSMRITCNGVLVGLSVAGESTGNNDSPILQIWRLTGSTSNDYERISEYTFPIGCTQLPNNVWQCTVSPPLTLRWETSLESFSLVIARAQHFEFTLCPHHLLPATY